MGRGHMVFLKTYQSKSFTEKVGASVLVAFIGEVSNAQLAVLGFL